MAYVRAEFIPLGLLVCPAESQFGFLGNVIVPVRTDDCLRSDDVPSPICAFLLCS